MNKEIRTNKSRIISQGANNIFANIISREGLHVRRSASAHTASFSPDQRILTLPYLEKKMPNYIEEGRIIHEVGHAIFTSTNLLDRYNKELAPDGVPFSFLNILEDVRINKLISRRYRGVKHIHKAYYEYLMDEGFFGEPSSSEYSFMDMINVFYKVGSYSDVDIKSTKAYKLFKGAIETLETENDVIVLTKKIFDYLKENQEEDTADNQNDAEDDQDQNQDDAEDGNQDQKQDDADNQNDAEDDYNQEGDVGRELNNDVNQFEASTNEEFERNLSNSIRIFDKKHISNLIIPENAYEGIIKEFDDIYSGLEKDSKNSYNFLETDWKKLLTEIKPIINHMVNKFESKKSAVDFIRSRNNDTGTLDVQKLHQYQITDEIFLQNTITPEGKNHGIMMLIDGSGSMEGEKYLKVIKQTIIMVMFAKRVSIPFEVYQFSSCSPARLYSDYDNVVHKDDYTINFDGIFMLKLIDNTLSKRNSQTRLQRMWKLACSLKCCWGTSPRSLYYQSLKSGIPDTFNGTPTLNSILMLIDIMKNFKKKNNIEKSSLVVLTDGDTAGLDVGHRSVPYSQKEITILVDSSERQYNVELEGCVFTNMGYDIFKEETASTIVEVSVDKNEDRLTLAERKLLSRDGVVESNNRYLGTDLSIYFKVEKFNPTVETNDNLSAETNALMTLKKKKNLDIFFGSLLAEKVAEGY